MDDKLQSLIIGALLHDIGKLIQRAAPDPTLKTHQEFGEEFLKEKGFNQSIFKSALYHHSNPTYTKKELLIDNVSDDNIARIVCEADSISASIDRKDINENEKPVYQKELILGSVFDNLFKEDLKSIKENYSGYYLREFSDESNINFPVSSKNKATDTVYKNIETDLKKSLKDIEISPNSILNLCEKYFTYLPSDTNKNHVPDISLFDHSKLTACIASCMYKFFKEEKNDDNYKKLCNQKEDWFLLTGGDISGIQEFIYTIASKGALKQLRARSFYLEIMLENIIDEILKELNLSRANVLYTGGGHFYLLLPNTKATSELVDKTKINVNKFLFEKYGGLLYLAIGTKSCNKEKLKKEYPKLFDDLEKSLSREKLQKYAFSNDLLEKVFTIQEDKDTKRECNSCRTSNEELQEDLFFDDDATSNKYICPNCSNFKKLGKKILEKDLKSFYISDIADQNDNIELPSINEKKRFLVFEPNNKIRSYNINSLTLDNSINLWMGNYGEVIEFKDLANSSVGDKKLAVMRADVDNLGKIFQSGFEEKLKTISRYTALSRQLTLFFKFYMNRVCEGNLKAERTIKDNETDIKPYHIADTEGEKNLVIVYSGGDDLFIVGAWNDVIDFAVDFKRTFDKFTCNNVTFSAGIGFFNPSFPVYQMAKLTGKLEDDFAKEYPDKENPTKDAVALFGIDTISKRKFVHSWDDFIDNILEDKIKNLFEKTFYFDENKSDKNKIKSSTGYLYKLMQLLKSINDEKDGNRINIARLAYTLARYELPENDKNKDKYDRFKDRLFEIAFKENPQKEINELLTAINLLIYKYRKGECK